MHYAIGLAALRLSVNTSTSRSPSAAASPRSARSTPPPGRPVSSPRWATKAAPPRASVSPASGSRPDCIGRVHTVHAWNGTVSKSYSHDDVGRRRHRRSSPAVPAATISGSASRRSGPYRKRNRSHGSWRGYVDYGTGRLGDWACHQLDAAVYALDLGAPLSVEPATTELPPGTFPASATLEYAFAARGKNPPVRVRWFDGGILPPQPVPGFKFNVAGGSIFYGDKGVMAVGPHSSTARLLPDARMAELRGSLPPKSIPRIVGGPHVEWVNAIRAGARCGSDFQNAAPLAEIALLGVAAIRAQARLDWDATAGRVTNSPAAQRFIGPGYDYRPGWGA
jgi:hypothetical protein